MNICMHAYVCMYVYLFCSELGLLGSKLDVKLALKSVVFVGDWGQITGLSRISAPS